MNYLKKEVLKIKFYSNLDLLIISIWTIFTYILITSPLLENTIIRTIFGLVSILFNPGYVLTAAIFPRKNDLKNIERIGLSLGMSIAIVTLIGLFLNYTFGIRLISILASLCIFIIGFIFIAKYRRRQLTEDQRFRINFFEIYQTIGKNIEHKNKVDNILTGILAFSMVLAISMLFIVITTSKTGERFTEFYILNSTTGKADNFPIELEIGNPSTLLVGVVNHEFKNVSYTVQIVLEEQPLISKDLSLANNQKWEKNITFVPDKKGNDMKLAFWLFKDDNFTEPYRELHLWVNITR